MTLIRLAMSIWLLAVVSAAADEHRVTLSAPPAMIDTGVFDYILPRFKLKTRIAVELTENGTVTLEPQSTRPVLIWQGQSYGPVPRQATGDAGTFIDWLLSDVGQNTIAAFEMDGAHPFQTAAEDQTETVAQPISGDVARGDELAHLHCGRCHVVSDRNRMGGIGSTPSFGAMKNFPDWEAKFTAFYALNPHPSFTQIEGVTEPFGATNQPHIAPVELTLEDVDAILAFMAQMPAKDLGSAVQAN